MVCCVTDLRPRACTLLCLSDEMSCRKQAVCLWDRHESDVCEPVQAEPSGRLLGEVGVWVTRGENNKAQWEPAGSGGTWEPGETAWAAGALCPPFGVCGGGLGMLMTYLVQSIPTKNANNLLFK